MPKSFESVKMKLLSLITLCAISSAHEITKLQVPLFADPRRPAVLSCHFQMDGQKLHSVKWYRDMNEIFRYNPSQKPPIRLYNVTGIMVQGGECQEDSCMMKVMPVPLGITATYTCEVSTEGPKFQIARKTKQMTVLAMPDLDPVITGAPKELKPGEQIFLNCTSDYSLPAAEINWYIDDVLQKPEPWQKTELSPSLAGGLRRSWRVLRVRVPTTASGALRVKCEAKMVVAPPVIRDVVAIITVHSQTQMSKYVTSNKGVSVSGTSLALVVISWTLTKISKSASL
ncbi:uncharacterized protein LOC135074611 [Ostrinia nubilalis]|uniref:uncharacterized protein LOC135074611 n=1 Tax=Ostrinia nubilalis TaxID=29057 RepID=UPI0030824232